MAPGSATTTRRTWTMGAAAVVVAVLALAGCGASSGDERAGLAAQALPAATETVAPSPSVSAPAEPSVTESPSATSTAAPPVVKLRTVVIHQRVAFTKKTVKDKNLAKGTKKVTRKGRSGYRDRIYTYRYVDGKLVSRTLVKIKVTKKPVTQITHLGTKVVTKKKCDPNYSGCVPIASDVDCAGGGGNGPAYVQGPVKVIGKDIYDLDAGHDGIGCE